ncbi:ABC1-domain-containing protein [Panus rudis PR-1116 ss-1]|nr:ABC1-domain-containing protein [Panus rudis PR-1116 ss-1]
MRLGRSNTESSVFTRRTARDDAKRRVNPWIATSATIVLLAGAGVVAYDTSQPFRHTVLAVIRCSRVAEAAVLGAIDYKKTFAASYDSEESRQQAYSDCHRRSAQRVLKALLANGGIFIKLGQHIASLVVLPIEWTSTMRPLQDQCEPTDYEDVEKLFLSDMGASIDDLFEEFDPKPVGVASLAQVHVGRLRKTGQRVAVKLQHPHLQEFCDIDMEMVEVALGWIKHWFPEFEFTWLGGEMRENLPKEMDFAHEARNAQRADEEFKDIYTSLYIPKVVQAEKRVLIMEFIEGGRVDDLKYLAEHDIDRNKVSLEIARIFGQMVHINGFFHADPHPGNLLIRPAQPGSKSPYNFEIALLDHGLYFDLDDELRVNYSKFLLSLMKPASKATIAERRKYAKLVGNVDEKLYPVFEAAITGRAVMKGSWDDNPETRNFKRAGSMIDMTAPSEAEIEAIRKAVIEQEGLVISVFDVLRRVPRRVLMLLKLNDLVRSLDHSLATTHPPARVFLITASYCTTAIWQDDKRRLSSDLYRRGLFGIIFDYFKCWWRFEQTYEMIGITEMIMDATGLAVKLKAWLRGLLVQGGLKGAHDAAAGLV